MQKKNIVFFINSILSGGAERVTTTLLENLQTDFNIHLVMLNNIIEYPLPESQKIFCFNQPIKENMIIKYLKLPLLAYRYKKYCRKNSIDVSFSLLSRANYINCFSRFFGQSCKIIISERTYLSLYLASMGKFRCMVGSFLTRLLYPKADLIIPNSELNKIDLQQHFKIKTNYKVIHNPIQLNHIAKLSEEKLDENIFEPFSFIHAGNFRPEKNHSLLIEAFSKIQDLNCRLLLLGKGDGEPNITGLVSNLGLKEKIIFLGFDKNPYKYFSKSDCLVLSSDFEGFPNVILEAAACHLPVITTDCKSGPREILAPGTNIKNLAKKDIDVTQYGILVPVGNADLLAKAMRLIYQDKVLASYLKSNAYERVKSFDSNVIINQFRKIFME